MIQTSFLNDELISWNVYIDGASRGNPGKSGAGIFIESKGAIVLSKAVFLGSMTNNQAEYLALTLALFFAQEYCSRKNKALPKLRIISDSQLLVKQIQGIYSVKNPILQSMKKCIMTLLAKKDYTIEHVLRHHNKKADALANQGIDTKKPMPQDFYSFISHHCPFIQDVLHAP